MDVDFYIAECGITGENASKLKALATDMETAVREAVKGAVSVNDMERRYLSAEQQLDNIQNDCEEEAKKAGMKPTYAYEFIMEVRLWAFKSEQTLAHHRERSASAAAARVTSRERAASPPGRTGR